MPYLSCGVNFELSSSANGRPGLVLSDTTMMTRRCAFISAWSLSPMTKSSPHALYASAAMTRCVPHLAHWPVRPASIIPLPDAIALLTPPALGRASPPYPCSSKKGESLKRRRRRIGKCTREVRSPRLKGHFCDTCLCVLAILLTSLTAASHSPA